MLKSICIISICLTSLFPFECKSTSVTIDPGVSYNLAKSRKKTISAVEYAISLDIPVGQTDSIHAQETITCYLTDIKTPLTLDFEEKDNSVFSIIINGKNSVIAHKNEHIIISNLLLIKGFNKIEIKYSTKSKAIHRDKEFLYSLFVPARARSFIPCFDQPDIKACFTLTVTIPSNWDAISNGSVKKSSTAIKKTIEFSKSDTISTYLFSVVAGKFQKQTRKIKNKEVNFFYRESDTAKVNASIDSIFMIHQRSLEFMENYTGIPYPFQKLDFIAIPDFPYGGMEHVGAIDYKASDLFLGRSATQNEKIARIHVIAHETSHMWFGNLVTMKWFDDVWMKEVFANFMADKIISSMTPDTNESFRFLLQHHPLAYYVDRTKGTHPIRQELNNLNEAGALYGSIIYEKAPIVMRQLEKTTGERTLQLALKKYLEKYSYQNADWPDLIRIIDDISSENINDWNAQWINNSGMPLITYSLVTKENKIEKFIIQQNNDQTTQIRKQYFTIAFVYNDSIKVLPINMNAATIELEVAKKMSTPLFILFNATGEGYGKFPIDTNMLSDGGIDRLNQSVMRASAYINLYENVLQGEIISPVEFLQFYCQNLKTENEILIIDRMLRQFDNIYWQFIPENKRKLIGPDLEFALWNITENSSGSKKKRLFQTYTGITLSENSIHKLYDIWYFKTPPAGISLEEEDYLSIATGLVIKMHEKSTEILQEQEKRIKDPDMRNKFVYTLPSLSNKVSVRDAFFDSLLTKNNRNSEDWIITSIHYLHHPLRHAESEKYLPETLNALQELQKTKGVFFPSEWLRNSLSYYQTKKAAEIVKAFLKQNPGYNKRLKNKILQEADDIFLASKLKGF